MLDLYFLLGKQGVYDKLHFVKNFTTNYTNFHKLICENQYQIKSKKYF